MGPVIASLDSRPKPLAFPFQRSTTKTLRKGRRKLRDEEESEVEVRMELRGFIEIVLVGR